MIEWIRGTLEDRIAREQGKQVERTAGYSNDEETLVFITGRGGAGFLIVTPLSLRPGVNILSFLPAPRRTGP